jgi:geranylgeranyl pyrophosphate synthase
MLDGYYEALSRHDLQDLLKTHGISQKVKDRLSRHVKQSIKNLAVLPKTEYRLCLEDIAAYVTERNK